MKDKKNEQTAPLKQENITSIKLPKDTAILWGGMPTKHLLQFANSEMQGFTAYRKVIKSLHFSRLFYFKI
ncbi:hypothetical protein I5515_05380 [Acinetobacter calcoaceticus]|nr:hypothetical protein [Acinetobacter calcoaceticus]